MVKVLSTFRAKTQKASDQSFTRWHGYNLFDGELKGAALITSEHDRVAVTLNGRSGTWVSPITALNQPVDTINPSWQVLTPPGAFVNIGLRVRCDDEWSNWYQMGQWSFGNTPDFMRTSFSGQSDAFGTIYTDTYVNTAHRAIDAYQLRAELIARGTLSPLLFQLAGQTAKVTPFSRVSPTTMKETIELPVPTYKQFTHTGEYRERYGGGEEWCCPSSIAMMLKYHGTGPTTDDIAALPPDPVFDKNRRANGEVTFAALHCYDADYGGTGNWPFGTAYAAHYGIDTAVRVFTSLQEVESEIKRHQPVILSLKWDNSDPTQRLPNAPLSSSSGHLLVVRGFEKSGRVIVNDPAASSHRVRRVYGRTSFERQWLNSSNGVALTFST